ncbi:MAG: poly(3-hydroxybutyrate) depolymerase, partial [Ilumatobacteraceae bacterium]|nr:poly(3-hydroxybutyrate) depolymerase [Ilumatobacteraceae bacterium]
ACSTVTNAAGESTIPFTGVGLTGTYILHLPPAVAGGDPLPLVLDLHGYSEPAAIQVVQSGLTTLGDTAGFVTALPQIDRPVPRWDSNVGSDDGKFLGALLDQIEATVCIDTNREFVAGLSNGAFMTSIVACDLSDRIAAVAPVAGIQAPDDCKPTRPVPVIAFHGTADTFVPYTGGLGSSVASLPSADGTGTIGTIGTGPPSSDPVSQGPSVPDRTSTWAVRNGCAASPTEETIAADVTLLSYDCPAGAEVQLYRVEGGGHAWPGSAFSVQIESVVGKTTLSIDATKLIWEFFAAHPLRH